MDTAHSLQKLYLCNFLITQRKEIQYQLQTVRWKNWYLKSGSVHIPGQFSSPSTGYHEHFIGVHLQKETLVSAQVKPTSWSEASKPCKQRFHETKLLVWGIVIILPVIEEHWVGEQVRDGKLTGHGNCFVGCWGNAGCYGVPTLLFGCRDMQ